MPGQSFSRGARLHSPLSLHCLYARTVTSVMSMQYGESVTWCAGRSFSSSFLSSEPMKNLPPVIVTVPGGHVGGAATTGTADADAGALADGTASVVVASLPR